MVYQKVRLIPRSTVPPIHSEGDIRQQARIQRLAIRKAFTEKRYDAEFRLRPSEYHLTNWWLGIRCGRYWTCEDIASTLERPVAEVRAKIAKALNLLNIPHSRLWGFA